MRETLPQPADIEHKSIDSTLDSDLDLTIIETKDALNECDPMIPLPENGHNLIDPENHKPDLNAKEEKANHQNQGMVDLSFTFQVCLVAFLFGLQRKRSEQDLAKNKKTTRGSC